MRLFFLLLAVVAGSALAASEGPVPTGSHDQGDADNSSLPKEETSVGIFSRIRTGITTRLRALFGRLGNLFRRGSPGEKEEELRHIEEAAADFVQCLPRRTVADYVKLSQPFCRQQPNAELKRKCETIALVLASKLSNAMECASLNVDNAAAVKECFKGNRWFLSHLFLSDPGFVRIALQSVSCAAGAEEGNVDAWISSLVMNRAMDYEISRGFPPVETLKVSRRFATVSVDTLPSKYYDHLEHVYRYRNIRLRQRIVTRFRRLFRRSQGFENTIPSHILSKAFENLKFSHPRVDPLSIRILSAMLHRGASCKRTPLKNQKTRVKVNGEVKVLTPSKMIEAAVLFVTENFADFGECAKDPQREEVTCRLLVTYDNQVTLKYKKTLEERDALQSQMNLKHETIPIWPEGIVPPSSEKEMIQETSFVQHQGALKSIHEHQNLSLLQRSSSLGEDFLVQPVESTLQGRIQHYALRARAQAVAAMNTAVRVSSFAWKLVRMFARKKLLCRALMRTVIKRFSPEDLGIDMLLLTEPHESNEFNTDDKQPIETLALLVRSYTEMLTGSAGIAKFAQQIAEALIEDLLQKINSSNTAFIEFGKIDADSEEDEDEFSQDDDLVGLSFAELEEGSEDGNGEQQGIGGDATAADETPPAPPKKSVLDRTRSMLSQAAVRVRGLQSQTKAALIFTSMAFVAAIMGGVGGFGVIFTGIVLSILLLFQGISYARKSVQASSPEGGSLTAEESPDTQAPPSPNPNSDSSAGLSME